MSAERLFAVLLAAQSVIGLLIYRRAPAFEAYAERMERAASRAEDAAIRMRVLVTRQEDLQRSRPVVPPDSMPDELQHQEVA